MIYAIVKKYIIIASVLIPYLFLNSLDFLSLAPNFFQI
ncbi:hypothetical protein SDC9_80428 [bioreactor metagenome]|uniref:Uncharacterized protein n=1 Tax=bioreactor metagenome TaxID=1076179 RepID=A0A644YZQ5_9ZZZZ